MGGLGNQMFQIAAAAAHCKRHGLRLTVASNVDQAKHGVYWDSILSKCAPLRAPYAGQSMWREQGFRYREIPKEARAIFGYFQSGRYFADCADEIRGLFDMPETTLTKYAELLTTPYTVIHIRRGDYVPLPEFHGILTQNYYRAATERMRELYPDTRFLVFSDDLPWARSLDFLADATFVDEPNAATALYLMSRFERYIISNSSFSWWAVWLGPPAKTVIAPDRWFGPKGPQDTQDVYEPSWIRMPAI